MNATENRTAEEDERSESPSDQGLLARVLSVRVARLRPGRLHKIVHHLPENGLVTAREPHLDKQLDKGAALDARYIKQLVVAIPRPDHQLRAVRDLAAPPYFIAAAHGNTSIGVTATPDTGLETLENARDDDYFGSPVADAGDDGHTIVDHEALGIAAIMAEEGVVYHFLVLDGTSLVPIEVGIRRDEG